MKRRVCSALLALVMALSMMPFSAAAEKSPFPDVTSADWFYKEVLYVNDAGLMTGTDNGFEPGLPASRAMIWTILARLSGEDTAVMGGEWYAAAQRWSVENGVSDGSDPMGSVTREQLAAMLYRFAKTQGVDVSVGGANTAGYDDAALISAYALPAMQWACAVGILTGDGAKLLPQGTATRAQLAVMLCRFMDVLVEEYTVTFAYNYAGAGSYETATVRSGESVDEPGAPTRDGYTFAGWYTSPTGGTRYDFDTAVTEDLTLYAHWTSKSTGSACRHLKKSFVDNGDGTHTVICERCRRVLETVAHSYEYTCNNDGTHDKSCVCGNSAANENCVLNEENNYTCVCGETCFYIYDGVLDDVIGKADLKVKSEILYEIEEDTALDFNNTTVFADTEDGISFVSKDQQEFNISNVTFTGSALGIYFGEYRGAASSASCNAVLNNVVLKNLKISTDITNKSDHISCGAWVYGAATLNNCTMTGTTTTQEGCTQYDIAFVNGSNASIDGGKYGSIYIYAHAHVTIENAEVDTIKCNAISENDLGGLTIASGTHVKTLIVECGEDFTPAFTIEDGATVDEIIYKVSAAKLKEVLTPDNNGEITLTASYALKDGENWTPLIFPNGGYNPVGKDIIINGDEHTIIGLDHPLVADNPAKKVVIKDLTIKDAKIGTCSNTGTGAFIGLADANDIKELTLENCHLIDSEVTGSAAGTGGLVGYVGNCVEKLTLKGCSVKDCTITGAEGAAGLVGFTMAKTEVENCKVLGTTAVKSEEDRSEKSTALAGYLFGTVSGNTVTIKNCLVDSTVTLTNIGKDPVANGYAGRIINGGTLLIDGTSYTA